ncbi:FecR family protein [Pseudozobellia thermophila]|uniref:FecR family protein n=1 Tax=Pseudozobellia thermophila TaxID=192903 RepID=A0A1M6F3A9_9FLAO|nr:FecR domain-containing protein [Pseudozobellia thermophila]SHI92161.1 FecR family protein [Pseudozobellia thermophila]
MDKCDFKISLAKFLSHSIASEELDDLNLCLTRGRYHKLFRSHIEIDYTTRYIMGRYNADKAKRILLDKIRRDKRSARRSNLFRLTRYAAVLLTFLGLGYFYWDHNFRQGTVGNVDKGDQITLELSDGTVKTISELGNASVYNRKGDRVGLLQGNQLVYHKGGKAKEILYNTVNVPYGKRFVLILSDGTKAHLNAGSTLRYPVEFVRGRERKVYLKGEGYFNVAKDETSPFIINANELNIQVLGTKFNLSAYPEDDSVKTVLVEGSVGFFTTSSDFDEDSKRLVPGQMAVWGKQDQKLVFKEVDTDLHTGWMNGKIIFSHMPFEDIVKKLERNYNVSIDNQYEALNPIRFNASFDTETITQVFEAFSKNYPMTFTINGDRIIIYQP